MSKKLLNLNKSILFGRTFKGANVLMRKQSTRTKDNVLVSPFQNVEIPKCTVYDYVWQNLDKWPERTVAVCSVTGRGYTYEQAFKLSNTFAANLRRKFKIRDGDAVAVMLPNIPDYPLVVLATLEAGGLVSTINPIYTAHEVSRQIQMSEAKVIVTLPETVNTVRDALKLIKSNIPIIAIKTNGDALPEGTVCFNELSEDLHVDKSCLKEVRRSHKDICFLPYSSGTTGLPKGVELSNWNLVANCQQMNDSLIACHNETTDTHQDAVMTVLPLFHIYAASVIMFHKMSHGCKLVTLSKFQPEIFMNALEKFRTNILFAAPPIILMMASHPASSPKVLQYLETIVNGAAPLAESDAERLFEKAKRMLDFRQGYGLTETSPVVTMSQKGTNSYGSVGQALPNTQLKIVDSNLRSLGVKETGELLVKGPQVMRGYKNNPQANTEAFTDDGWFRTGDLAFADENDTITIADRLKELIKVKGFQVPPAELEAVLREHPAVNDAAIIGVPHPTTGEAPKAFVVLKQNQSDKTKQLKDIVNYVNERVAFYKRIDDIVVLETIPKSATGKIMRKTLKEKYC